MYMVEAYDNPEAYNESITARFFGKIQLGALAARAELWGSSFEDPGEDFNEIRFYSSDGILVGDKRLEGY